MSTIQDFQTKQEQARQMRYARSKFRRINSLDLIPEDPSQEQLDSSSSGTGIMRSERRAATPAASKQTTRQLARKPSLTLSQGIGNVLLFWPNLLLNLAITLLRYLLFIPLSIAAPSFWLSALLWIFWKLIRVPISFVKWLLQTDSHAVVRSSSSLSAPASSASSSGPKRTILISCGSTIQALHLARNFYSSGARVVVFDFEGLFGLARFSTAVDKFYVVPRPTPQNPDSYITALCHIVNKERPSAYLPVCATSPAYYDALAKPHLELLGCACFIPGLQETIVLDDCLQLYQKCAAAQIALPPHPVLSSLADLWHLYESDFIANFRNILMAVGMQGLLERYKYILPNARRDFKFAHDISAQQQWMLVRDLPGHHYITCTTVKESRVVANVTCRVDHDTKNLVPVTALGDPAAAADEAQIDRWLSTFFTRVRFQRPINGHISFRMVKCQTSGEFLPLGVRLGVSLPYLCYNRSHAQIFCRTLKCVHMRQLSFTTAALSSSSSDEESALSALSWSSLEKSSAIAALDKREALFAYWDPLPYCAYYHFQLPLESVKLFLQKRHHQHERTAKSLSPRITMPVH